MTDYYGTVAGGNAYFAERLRSTAWTDASDLDKEKALKMATRAIENLNFAGDKHDENQPLEFPRGRDTSIPDNINNAAYECAFEFLKGTDIEEARRNFGVVSERFSFVGTTYDRGGKVSDWLQAGIPSSVAWDFLLPYLLDPRTITISRV